VSHLERQKGDEVDGGQVNPHHAAARGKIAQRQQIKVSVDGVRKIAQGSEPGGVEPEPGLLTAATAAAAATSCCCYCWPALRSWQYGWSSCVSRTAVLARSIKVPSL